jgi:hypothetical protein
VVVGGWYLRDASGSWSLSWMTRTRELVDCVDWDRERADS